MENPTLVLKAVADETRMQIIKLLLRHNFCVGALANRLNLTESAISQHLKVLREAGLLIGKKRGYFMHYDVDREQLKALAAEIEELAVIERELCKPEEENCIQKKRKKCRSHQADAKCSEEVRFACHGSMTEEEERMHHEHCKCK